MIRGRNPSGARLAQLARAICALLAAFCTPAMAAPSDTGSAASVAQVNLVAPASLIKTRDMAFGYIIQQAAAGTVVLDAATDTCTTTNGLIRMGQCRSAQFAGMGVRNLQVRINGPTSILLTGPGQSMVLDTFRLDTSPDLTAVSGGGGGGNGNGNAFGWSNAPGQNNRRFRIVSPTGIFTFGVGGTLRVNANQAAGVYTGTFDVTVQYQ